MSPISNNTVGILIVPVCLIGDWMVLYLNVSKKVFLTWLKWRSNYAWTNVFLEWPMAENLCSASILNNTHCVPTLPLSPQNRTKPPLRPALAPSCPILGMLWNHMDSIIEFTPESWPRTLYEIEQWGPGHTVTTNTLQTFKPYTRSVWEWDLTLEEKT